MASPAFQIKILGDVADASRSLKSLDKRTKGLAKAFSAAGKIFAGAFVVTGVVKALGSFIERAEKVNSVVAITNKVLEQTGAVAGVSVDGLTDMNRALAMRTGIDKVLIQEGSNVLLTFKNIRNEVGKGNDIFDQANEMVLDMATVFGGSAATNAKVLGKALNDPIAGISALTRVGVTFTDEQKEQIKALQESGDMLGAQAIIMGELQSQVGGTAVASADATAKISQIGNEVKESIGNALLPLVEKAADYLVNVFLPAWDNLLAWFRDDWPAVYDQYFAPTIENIRAGAEQVISWLSAFWTEHGEKIMAFVSAFVKIVWDYYAAIFGFIFRIVKKTMEAASKFWDEYGETVMSVLSAWWDVTSTVVSAVAGTIGDLVRIVTALFNGDWQAAWDIAGEAGQRLLDFFVEFPGKVGHYLMVAIGAVGRGAAAIGRALINGVIGFWNRLDPHITIGPMPSWVPGIGGKSWTSPDMFPDLPRMAAGGIVRSPTVALIGEAGPEAVIPLGAGGMGDTHIYFNGIVGDPAEAGRMIKDALAAYGDVRGVIA